MTIRITLIFLTTILSTSLLRAQGTDTSDQRVIKRFVELSTRILQTPDSIPIPASDLDQFLTRFPDLYRSNDSNLTIWRALFRSVHEIDQNEFLLKYLVTISLLTDGDVEFSESADCIYSAAVVASPRGFVKSFANLEEIEKKAVIARLGWDACEESEMAFRGKLEHFVLTESDPILRDIGIAILEQVRRK